MANRIIIFDSAGAALIAMDGHHGSRHASDWTAQVLADFAARGIEAVAVEVIPQEGGDAMRRDVIGALADMRAEFHVLPDGRRELIGLHVSRRPATGESPGRAAKAAIASVPEPVRGGVRVLHAPPDVANRRCCIRVGRGRDNPPPGQPRTPADIRTARKAQRAARRRIAAPGSTA